MSSIWQFRAAGSVATDNCIANIVEMGSLESMGFPRLNTTGDGSVSRLKEAALGFAITIAPIIAVVGAQYTFAPYIVYAVSNLEPEIDTWAVPAYRSSMLIFHGSVILLLAAYWFISIALSKGHFLKIQRANVTLFFSGLVFLFAMIVSSVMRPFHLLEFACPFLGLSDAMPQFGFDGFSDCEMFARDAAPLTLLGLPAVLLVVSAVLRVVISRRRYRSRLA